MSDTASLRRQLKIKSGVVKRYNKELNLYQKETEQLKLKVDKFTADNAEEWDIKNAKKMLDESERMIKDTSTRLGHVMQDLRNTIVLARQDPALSADEDLLKAEEEMQTATL